MKQPLINLILSLLVIWGLSYWAIAGKAFLGLQSDKGTDKAPCVVISTRADEALDLHSHLSELSKADFLTKYAALSKQPMIRLEFPLLHTKPGVPTGGNYSAVATALVDCCFAKFIIPFTFLVGDKEFIGSQEVYPVPMWLDPRPDFSKMTSWATWAPGHPENAYCAAIVWWQISKLVSAGLLLIVIPGVFLKLNNLPVETETDRSIDKIYNERFGKRGR